MRGETKSLGRIRVILCVAGLSTLVVMGVRVSADPPAAQICNVKLDTIFCQRVTGIEGDAADGNKFRVEFEIVNWTGTDAAGLIIALNVARNRPLIPPGAPRITGASVDMDGRPLTGGSSPPTGNAAIANDWSVLAQTPTRVEFRGGTAIAHPSSGVFDGLLDPDFSTATLAVCIDAIKDMIPGDETMVGAPPLIASVDTETIDDGANVRDGFVIEIDDWDAGEEVSFNWFLVDAAGDVIGASDPSGAVVADGDGYGFGAFNIVRLAGSAPTPLFDKNAEYDPTDTTDPNVDSPLFWAEDEVAGVDTFQVNPIPVGTAGEGTFFAVELGVSVTGPFADSQSDNDFFRNGSPFRVGVNLVPNAHFMADHLSSTAGTTILWGSGIWTLDGVDLLCPTFDGAGVTTTPGNKQRRAWDESVCNVWPNDWHWTASFSWLGEAAFIDVWVRGFDQDELLSVDLQCSPTHFLYSLEVDLVADTYTLTDDGAGTPFHTGVWGQYPGNLPADFEDAGGWRGNFSKLDTKIPAVSDWGLVVLTLLVLSSGTLVVIRRRTGAAQPL